MKKPRAKPKCVHCAERDADIDMAVRLLQVPVKSYIHEIAVREYEKKINRVIDILLIAKSKEVE